MNNYFGVPGIGGSLGCCALCGDNFLMEILMGGTIRELQLEGQTLCVHKGCTDKYGLKNGESRDLSEPAFIDSLPNNSPLKQAIRNEKIV